MITKRNDLLSKKVIQSLKNRHMNGYYVHSKQEAVDLAFEIMKPGSSVGWGGSDTLNKIGIKEELYKRNFKVIVHSVLCIPSCGAPLLPAAPVCPARLFKFS